MTSGGSTFEERMQNGRKFRAEGKLAQAATEFLLAFESSQPADESALRELMATYSSMGEPKKATLAYENYADWLKDKHGKHPEPRTTTIYNNIRGDVL